MMLGVLVLAKARQEGPCCDVMFSGFCGLVPVGVFEFPPVFGFCEFFPFSFSFLFWCSFVYFIYA